METYAGNEEEQEQETPQREGGRAGKTGKREGGEDSKAMNFSKQVVLDCECVILFICQLQYERKLRLFQKKNIFHLNFIAVCRSHVSKKTPETK